MTLSPEQIERIEYLACDEWIVDTGGPDDDARSWSNFVSVLNQMSSIELHHFACNFNWDCGVRELGCVIDHPECDLGTAFMIYWLGQPASHYRRELKGKQPTGSSAEIIALLRKIESKIDSVGFAYSEIACDPANIMGQPMTMGTD